MGITCITGHTAHTVTLLVDVALVCRECVRSMYRFVSGFSLRFDSLHLVT